MSQAQAQTELTCDRAPISQREHPDTNKNRGLVVRTELQARMAQDPPDAMLIAMLSTLAFAVLFVACANVAGLLTSRAPVRAREMALRLAIGAGRGRLVRQLVTESLLIAIAGGVLGLGIGYAGMTLFRQIEMPTDLPIMLAFQMDRRALIFSLVVAVASAVLFGLVPAHPGDAHRSHGGDEGERRVAPGRRRRWGRAILVGGQVAVSVVLLVVAMFMYRGFREQLASGPGYRTDHLLMMSFDHEPRALLRRAVAAVLPAGRGTRARGPGRHERHDDDVDPDVERLDGLVTIAPEGFQFPAGKENVTVLSSRSTSTISTRWRFRSLQGRNFTVDDDANAPRVAIVNQQLAKHYWPNQDPIGKRFRLNDADKTWVADRRRGEDGQVPLHRRTAHRFRLSAVPPAEAAADGHGGAVCRRSVERLSAPLREVVRGLDVNQPIYNVRTMEALYQMRAVSIFNVLITMVGSMGLMGLGLAIVGLYGLVAYAATRRTREIGIRMAIGADRTTVLRMVLRQGVLLALVGLVVGLVASIGAGELLAAAFPQRNNQRDLLAPIVVAPIVLAVTFLAAYIPARRASRINPMQALRYE